MSWRRKLGKLLLGMMLFGGALSGAPMRPEEIEEMMHGVNQQQIAYTIPDRDAKDDDLLKKLLGGISKPDGRG